MSLCLVYVYPLNGHQGHFERAAKFVSSYDLFRPAIDHETIVISNGAPVSDEMRFMFSALKNCRVIEGDDSAYDISAYQQAAQVSTADLMVFCGGNSYIRRPEWMTRIVQSFERRGDTLYGCSGNTGVAQVGVQPHVRTTGFWISRNLFNSYPIRVTHVGARYEFEHGRTGLTSWIIQQGRKPWIVAVDHEYPLANCNMIPGGYHRGDQSNLLIGDRLTMPPFHPWE